MKPGNQSAAYLNSHGILNGRHCVGKSKSLQGFLFYSNLLFQGFGTQCPYISVFHDFVVGFTARIIDSK
jgi:hypothetical protein